MSKAKCEPGWGDLESQDHPTPPLACARVDPPPPGEGEARPRRGMRIIPIQIFKQPRLCILAAEFRASVRFSFRFAPDTGASLLPKRERSAARRNFVSDGSLARSRDQPCEAGRARRRSTTVFMDGGTPLHRRPAMAIAPWPSDGDATEDSIRGSLVSREAFSTRLPGAWFARPMHAGSPLPIHAQSLCRAPLSEWGYVRHTHGTGQRQYENLILARGSLRH